MPLFYLSFCDPAKPKGAQFVGACIVRADDMLGAVPSAWLNGCNPGGEAAILEIPKEGEGKVTPADINRLFTKAELEEKWGPTVREDGSPA